MLEKCEKKTENEEYLKKVYPLQNLGKKFHAKGEFKYLAIMSKW